MSIDRGSGMAMVRPESVTVRSDPDGLASVLAVAFLAPMSRLHCETADGTEVVVQLNSSRASAFAPGTRVSAGPGVRWRAGGATAG